MSLSHRGIGTQSFDRTRRVPHPALIRTDSGLEIRGSVYLVPGTRVLDLLERDTEQFIAVTDAVVVEPNGSTMWTSFVSINKAHITVMEETNNSTSGADAAD
ncbi:MAG TPA: hypothetical protein VFC51_07325 [Chloroflexota bacterium]|nr:hypothetical protein [Chloroflexota bacterium]